MSKALYNPSGVERERITAILKDYEIGHNIMTTPYKEFNRKSVLQKKDESEKRFNIYIEEGSADPDKSWMANTKRPTLHNKIVTIGANVTASIMIPEVFARNKSNEAHREAAEVMKLLMEYARDEAKYDRSFLHTAIMALVHPAVIMESGYARVTKKVRTLLADGTMKLEEVLDDILSGYQAHLVPIEELYITQPYQNDIQRQRSLIRKKRMPYSEAEQWFGWSNNFDKYVEPGLHYLYNADDDTFYKNDDTDLEGHEVSVETYYNRTEDLEILVVNGVMISSPNFPMRRADKKYPFAKGGYQPMDEKRFFYYKSLADLMGADDTLLNTMYNMVMDGTFLNLMPPLAIYGNEDIDSDIIVPGKATFFTEKDTKLEPISTGGSLNAGLNALNTIERSMDETSVDDVTAGMSTKGRTTKKEIEVIQQQAATQLSLYQKMLGFLVEDFGDLMQGDILQHMTVGEVMELGNGDLNMKFRKFILPDKVDGGKKLTKVVEFTPEFSGTLKDTLKASYDVLEAEGGLDSENRIYKVNPSAFREMSFKTVMKPDMEAPRNKQLERLLDEQTFDKAAQFDFVDREAMLRDFILEPARPGESSKYIKKAPQQTVPTPQGPVQSRGEGTNMMRQLMAGNQ